MDISNPPKIVPSLFGCKATSIILQSAVSKLVVWKTKLNKGKLIRIDFKLTHQLIFTLIEGKIIPTVNSTRYLSLHLNCKPKLLGLLANFIWLIGPHLQISLKNRSLIYTIIFRPAWTRDRNLGQCSSIQHRNFEDRRHSSINLSGKSLEVYGMSLMPSLARILM